MRVQLNRRRFIGAMGLAGMAALPWPRAWAGVRPERTVVLVELNGGNDGLNTVVPHGDPLYYKLRPKLGIAPDEVRQLDRQIGLNPALDPLWPAWRMGEVAIVLGVGYPQPDRSHFRSIEIWDTAADAEEFREEGWLASLLAHHRSDADDRVDGVIFGRPYAGPLVGEHARVLVMDNPKDFAGRAKRIAAIDSRTGNAALDHILRVQADARGAAEVIERKLNATGTAIATPFPRTAIGGQFANAARLLAADIRVPAIKVSQGGYDTHGYQRGTQDRLLGELAAGLAAFRTALIERGLWDRVVVMTYSEFGRRPQENNSFGTDHGTAAPHFVLGGRVRGGLYGRQPPLDALVDGDVVHSVDFRSLYATVAKRWWDIDPLAVNRRAFPELDFLA